jgi:hypothetical protein
MELSCSHYERENGTFKLDYGTPDQQIQWRRDKVQELYSKDTAKERYPKYYKLDWLQ